MPKPNEYKHIAAWGQMMNSFGYYITMQQEEAAKDNAPLDAIYKREPDAEHPTGWRRYADVENQSTRYTMNNILRSMGVQS